MNISPRKSTFMTSVPKPMLLKLLSKEALIIVQHKSNPTAINIRQTYFRIRISYMGPLPACCVG